MSSQRLGRRCEARARALGRETAMPNAANAALATQWQDLWNGDLGVADRIIAQDFLAHAAPLTGTGPDEIRGREALKRWISGIHTVLTSLTFAIDVGPI